MPGVALERIASLRAETGAVPRQLEHPAVLPSGRIFAIRMPDRKLVSLEQRAGTLSLREIAAPAGIYVPVALAGDAAGRLLVLDPSINRVVRFSAAGTELRAAGSFGVGAGAVALCAMNGRVYVYRPGAARPVAAYSEAGAAIVTFGRQFGSGSARRREAMSRAELLCLPTERRLVVASTLTGELQSYDEGGRMLWSRRAAGVIPLPVLDGGGGRIAMMSPPGGYHMLASVTELRPGWLLAQYGFRAADQASGFRRMESRFISLASGTEAARQDDLPGPLTSMGSGRAISLDPSSGGATLWRVMEKR